MVVPTLLYGCGNLTLLQQHARNTETAEMKFFRPVAQCTLYDHEINGKRRTKYQYIQFAWNYCGLQIPVDITFTNSEWYTHYQVCVWLCSCWQKTHRSTKVKIVRWWPNKPGWLISTAAPAAADDDGDGSLPIVRLFYVCHASDKEY